ncbi:serine hydrolase domain-containing protein [Flavobacterium reichenbachii]|uniref:serine hydrolase domain-containing protein n=1 Tax=Flavobacterium reichenbachii TaxID=362418 RepID=UPI00055162A8|nr:serine hydrolase domain-containing protein [Flavobacterium reichenbachii]OXB15816.1 serine hydrolase [Flavobacterium reichenbachii]
MKIKIFILFIVIFSINLVLSQDKKKEIIDCLKKEMDEKKIPGCQLVVLRDNKILLSEVLGTASLPFSIPVKKNTIFSINSISKVFTSVAVMQLQEQNKININEPISHYIDSIPENWKKITIKQLMSHTSGLPDIEDDKGLIGNKGQDSAWSIVKKLPMQYKVGEKFNYNATNYFILQRIIEKYSGTTFEKFVRRNQFDPLGIKQLYYGNSYDVITNKCPTYSYYNQDLITNEYIKGTKLKETYEEFPSKMISDAGAFTTAEEMAKWIIGLQSGKLLKTNEEVETIWEPVKLNDGSFDGFGGLLNAYALGWPVIVRKNHPAAASVGGGRAAFIIYPKDNLTIILFSNLTGIFPEEIIEKIAKIYVPDIGN